MRLLSPLLLATALAAPAAAADDDEAATGDEAEAVPVELGVAFSLGGSGYDGDIGFRGGPFFAASASPDDLLKPTEPTVAFTFTADLDRFGFWSELTRGGFEEAARLRPIPVGSELELDLLSWENAGYYRWELGRGKLEDKLALDAYGGLRYVALDAEASFPPWATFTADPAWIDPFLGARLTWRATDKLTVGGQLDLGGFGIGSKLTRRLAARVDYRFHRHWSVGGRVQLQAIDHDDDAPAFVYDVTAVSVMGCIAARF